MLLSLDTSRATDGLSPQYGQVLRLMAGRKSTMNPATMAEIVRLLVDCSDGEKCAVHHLMERHFVGEDPFLRFHWLLAKAGRPGCMPTDRHLYQELQALANEYDRRTKR